MRLPRGSGLLLLSAALALVVPVMLVRSAAALATPAGVSAWRWVAALGLGGVCYLLSHVARATRLAMISGQLLGVSLRTAALVHLFVAPWSIILPFKLDELLRWRELARISGHISRALIACLIDRTADGIVLLGLLMLFSANTAGGSMDQIGLVMMILLGLAIGASLVCFVVLPSMLEAVQQYLFEHHFGARAIQALAAIHHIRIELTRGRDTISRSLPWLLVCTLIAWLLELGAVLAVLGLGLDQSLALRPTVLLLLHRAGSSASILNSAGAWQAQTPERALSVEFLAALALAWAAVAPAYLRRWRSEPRRRRSGDGNAFSSPAGQVST